MTQNIKTAIGTVTIVLALAGCGSSDSNNNSPSTPDTISDRFVKMTMMEQNVMQDTKTGLEWVEGNNKAGVNSGCNPIGAGQDETGIKTIAEEFCSDLTFTGRSLFPPI